MSHLSTVQLNIKDQECLIQALVDVGIQREYIKVHEDAVLMSDGQRKANILISKQHSKSFYTDLGFELGKDGNYVAHMDLWGSGAQLKNDIMKRYTYHLNYNKAKASGWRVLEETFKDPATNQECVRLRLRR